MNPINSSSNEGAQYGEMTGAFQVRSLTTKFLPGAKSVVISTKSTQVMEDVMLNILNPDDINRRARRSEEPAEATRFQLEQVVRDFEIETCFVVDEAGEVLNSSCEPCPAMQRLASWVPTLTRRSWRKPSAHPTIDGFEDLAVSEFRIDGKRLYMAATGGSVTMRNVAVFRAILGMRRIHGTS